MLVRSGDLIPVQSEAIHIPWTKRKSLMLNFLHRGPVTFDTYVYDTNVGDVSALSAYFNPERWSVRDLNERFGIQPQDNQPTQLPDASPTSAGGGDQGQTDPKVSLVPKLLIYPLREPEDASRPAVELPAEFMSMKANTQEFYFPPPSLPFKGGQTSSSSASSSSSNNNNVMLPTSIDFSLAQAFQSLAYEHMLLPPIAFSAPLNLVNLCHQYDDLNMLQAVFKAADDHPHHADMTMVAAADESGGSSSLELFGLELGGGGLPQSMQWILQTINSSSVLETSA